MANLATCIKLAGDFLPPEARRKIVAQAAALRKQGIGAAEASRQAVQDAIAKSADDLGTVEGAIKRGETLYEPAEPKPITAKSAAKAEGDAAQARLAEVQAAHPDLQVMLDGMDQPMRMADFLAAVKAEADEMEADAPLMKVAAQCAITNGL
jgi:hypothetical protein